MEKDIDSGSEEYRLKYPQSKLNIDNLRRNLSFKQGLLKTPHEYELLYSLRFLRLKSFKDLPCILPVKIDPKQS